MKDRELWGDIARGICIIFVLVRHSPVDIGTTNLITWFVMPAFFIISGYFSKPLDSKAALISWLKKRTGRLLIPYFTFLIILSLLVVVLEFMHINIATTSDNFNLVNIIIGGRALPGLLIPLWYITVLYLTQVYFTIINQKLKTATKCLIPIAIAYVVAHVESWLVHDHSFPAYVPFGADIALLALSYYAFGFYAKSFLGTFKKQIFLASGVFVASMIGLNALGVFDYTLNMIELEYTNFVLDIVIPVITTVFFIQCCHLIIGGRIRDFFVVIGKNSLAIYVLSGVIYGAFLSSVSLLLGSTLASSLIIIVVGGILALIIPLIVSILIINRFRITRILFAGQYEGSKANKDRAAVSEGKP